MIIVKRAVRSVLGTVQWRVREQLCPSSTTIPLVSFCTTMMDRLQHIQLTLPTNMAHNAQGEAEFVLLNYGCQDPQTDLWVESQLEHPISIGSLRYYKYPDAKQFRRSHSRNMAFRLAQGEIICNIDADNFTGPRFADFVRVMMRGGECFLRGPCDGRGLGGRICVHKRHFEAVGGYDERLEGWGYEDTDLATRLRLIGLRHRSILPERFLNSLQHSDEIRMKHHKQQDRDKSANSNKAIADKNIETRVCNPNGANYGRGRVQLNFGDWIDL